MARTFEGRLAEVEGQLHLNQEDMLVQIVNFSTPWSDFAAKFGAETDDPRRALGHGDTFRTVRVHQSET